ncbi:TRAP transporter small permease [Novispirillum sp. DQ9]|uniref:TRAP transporter small permease n=1 Tax=Novispirillum sp. DQ9 TaxID=3398612 RepID=UPI003C7E4EC9
MKVIGDAVFRLSQAMYFIAGVLLLGMVVVILVEVVGRTLFGATAGTIDFTFIGGIEIVSHALLFMVLFTLPHAVSRGQVIVDLFTEGLSERAKGILAGVYTLGFGVLGAAMTVRFIESAHSVASSGQVTQDLQMPLSTIYGVTACATAVLALRGVLEALRQIVESVKAS